MLNILRKKAQLIVIIIVVGFVGTMFTGMFFLKGMGDDESREDLSQAVGISGDIVVTQPLYYNQLQEDFGKLIQRGIPIQEIDPVVIEMMKWQSFNKALDYATLLKIAKEKKIKAKKSDIKFVLLDIYKQYDLKNKSELKAHIQQRGLSYDQLMKNIKDNIIIQKLSQESVKDILITERDIKNKYTELYISHILFTGENAENKALSASEELKKGGAFEKAVQQFSEDTQSKNKKGVIGWVRMGQLAPNIETGLYSLSLNDISEPIKGPMGVHLFKVSKKRDLKKPENFNLENERLELTRIRQQRAIQTLMQPYRQDKDVRINEFELLAVYAKTQQNTQVAEGAYYQMISKTPSSPIPHYLLGTLYLKSKNLKASKKELEKAEILADVDDNGSYVYINMTLADLFKQKKWHKNKRKQYEKAIKKAKGNLYANYYLKDRFSELKDIERLARVNREIKTLEMKVKQQIEAQKEAQSTTENKKISASILEENK